MAPGIFVAGKFPLEAISRGVIPDAVIDRPKGYFPVPALKPAVNAAARRRG